MDTEAQKQPMVDQPLEKQEDVVGSTTDHPENQQVGVEKENIINRIFKNKKSLLLLIAGIVGLLAALLFGVLVSNRVSKGPVEITWWGLWEDDTIVRPIISDYESKNPNVKINYIKQSKEDYRQRLINSLVKGEGPDIFRFHNSWLPMLKSELASVPASVFSNQDFVDTFYPVMASDLQQGSSFYGVPLEYDGLALYINEEIFEKSGKNYPTTWNDLRQVARELTVKDDKNTIIQSGVALGRTENVDHWPEILSLMLLQNQSDMVNLSDRLSQDGLVFFTLFSSEDGVWDATLPNSTVYFASGKLAMYFGPSWRAFEIRAQNPNLKFKTIPVPQLPKTAAIEPDVNYASYWVEGVSSGSKNKDESWKFLKYLSDDENLEKLYTSASKFRMFGEPYPKLSMASKINNHPIIGSIIQGAPTAQTSYLHSRTWDGSTGINSQMVKYFEDAINAINKGEQIDEVSEILTSGVAQVLSQYGIRVQ